MENWLDNDWPHMDNSYLLFKREIARVINSYPHIFSFFTDLSSLIFPSKSASGGMGLFAIGLALVPPSSSGTTTARSP